MPAPKVDRNFPVCCTSCPHLEPVSASCTHEMRQRELVFQNERLLDPNAVRFECKFVSWDEESSDVRTR